MTDDDRRKKFSMRYAMYNDNYRDQVVEKLGQIYKAFAALKLDVQINDNNNLYKQVVNSISNVYSYGVSRIFNDSDTSTDNDTSTQKLYTAALRVDKVMTQANRYMNAFNDVLLQVTWDSEKEIPMLMLRLPHHTIVEYSGGKVESVRYFVGMITKEQGIGKAKVKVKTERWVYWSITEHYYVDIVEEVETITAIDGRVDGDGKPDFTNPLGVLPFVFMHNGWRDESFWNVNTGDDLTGGTVDMAVHLTFLNHIIKSQSFKQLVGSGDSVTELLGQVLDPLSVLTLTGQNTKLEVLDMQSNFDMLNKVIQELANTIAVSYGISPSQFRMTKEVSSGFALQMENLKLDRFTLEQQQDFVVYEKELFELLIIVSDYYNKPISDSNLVIDFVEPHYPVSPEQQITIDKAMIDLGLTSPAKVLMRINTDLDAEAAKIEIDDNINARNELLNKVSTNGDISATIEALGIET